MNEEARRAVLVEVDHVAGALDDVILYATQVQNTLVHVREQLSTKALPTAVEARTGLGDLSLCAKELREAVEDLRTSIDNAKKVVSQ